jgi:hypothetical protein
MRTKPWISGLPTVVPFHRLAWTYTFAGAPEPLGAVHVREALDLLGVRCDG